MERTMMNSAGETLSVIGVLTAWRITTGGIQRLFKDQEEQMKPETLRAISNWLRAPFNRATTSWLRHFSELFDRVFGARHFTWSCYKRSCIASLVAIAIITLVWASLYPEEVTRFAQAELAPLYVLALITTVLLFNLPTDYVSLLETRLLLKRFEGPAPAIRVVALICADVFLTLAITLGPGLLFARFVYIPLFFRQQPPDIVFRSMISYDNVIRSLQLHTLYDWLPIGTIFYSAFFTSVWLWLYGIVGVAIQGVNGVDQLRRGLVRWYNIDEHPLVVLGTGVNIIVSVAFIAALLYLIF
jgi:hypothetical protein